MQQPLVSIIIPTYNRAKMIIKTLDSIFAQTYQNFEVIVVDDGSTDNTIQILNDYKPSVSRNDIVLKILEQENTGAPAARNNGLRNADGEYIVFFDSDDLMLPERIKKQVHKMIEDQSDCCAAGYLQESKQKKLLPHILKQNALYSFFKGSLWGSTQCWMFKKSLILQVNGYDEALSCRQDIDITFRILMQCPKISIIREALSIFVDHNSDERIMKNMRNNSVAYVSFVRYHLKVIDYCVMNKELKLLFVSMRRYCGDIVSMLPINKYSILRKELMLVAKRNHKYSLFYQIYIFSLAFIYYHYYFFLIEK
jgi:glycosyltransferase involved in cell wall biosynthesis